MPGQSAGATNVAWSGSVMNMVLGAGADDDGDAEGLTDALGD